MNAFSLVLDTTPPLLSWTAPEVRPGQPFTVNYAVTEPNLRTVALVDDTGFERPAEIGDGTIVATMPATESRMRLKAVTTDLVGNTATYWLPLGYRVARAMATILDSIKTLLRIDDRPAD